MKTMLKLCLKATLFSLVLGYFNTPLAEPAMPTGAVVLTVVGDIANTNRPAFDAQKDSFFNYHKLQFEQAMAFDRDMLMALETQKIRVGMPTGGAVHELEGPLLKEILNATGVTYPATLIITALDGFKIALDPAMLDAHDWIVALKQDGQYLGLGGKGPIWVVFPPAASDGIASKEEVGGWPWASFVIEVDRK